MEGSAKVPVVQVDEQSPFCAYVVLVQVPIHKLLALDAVLPLIWQLDTHTKFSP